MSDAPILAGIHQVEDLAAAGDFEKKHTPFIEAVRDGDRVVVSVEVGHGVPHPNQPDHFIEWIAVHASGVPVARFSFAAAVAAPRVTCVLDVDADTPISAMASCNLHGLWMASAVAP